MVPEYGLEIAARSVAAAQAFSGVPTAERRVLALESEFGDECVFGDVTVVDNCNSTHPKANAAAASTANTAAEQLLDRASRSAKAFEPLFVVRR